MKTETQKINPNRNRKRGKATERALAKRVGGRRVGLMGKDDINAGPYSIEVKSRVAFAGKNFMAQAIRNCPTGKTPLVIVHLLHKDHGDDLVMIRLRDWESLMGNVKGYPE